MAWQWEGGLIATQVSQSLTNIFFRLKTLEKLLMVFHLQAKDRTLRILDPRADVTASETKSHDGIKDSKVGQVGKQLPFQGNQEQNSDICNDCKSESQRHCWVNSSLVRPI